MNTPSGVGRGSGNKKIPWENKVTKDTVEDDRAFAQRVQEEEEGNYNDAGIPNDNSN